MYLAPRNKPLPIAVPMAVPTPGIGMNEPAIPPRPVDRPSAAACPD
jgi:hypothetical protein